MKKWQIWTCILVLVIGILSTWITYSTSQAKANENEIILFRNQSDKIEARIQSALQKSFEILISMRSFYLSSEFVTPLEFKTFTSHLLKTRPYVYALEWVPRVEESDLQAFTKTQQKGNPKWRVFEHDKHHNKVTPKSNSFYYPVTYLAPLNQNFTALGYNVYNGKTRIDAINLALRVRDITASGPINLVHFDHEVFGFLLVTPYDINNNLLISVYQYDLLVKDLLQPIIESPIDFEFSDVTNPNDPRVFNTTCIKNHCLHTSFTLDIYSRKWKFSLYKPYEINMSLSSSIYLCIPVALTAIVVLVLSVIFMQINKKSELLMVKDTNLSVLAHEIKGPLSAIIGYITVLTSDEKYKFDDEPKNLLTKCLNSANMLYEITKFKLATKENAEKRTQIDLSKTLQKTLDLVENLAKTHNVHLESQIEENTIVKGSDTNLQQSFYNVISNGIKHSKDRSIKITSEAVEGQCIITVADTGDGIDAKKLPRVFDLYYKSNSSKVEAGISSGIGLAVAKQILEDHDGTIEISSKKGEGTTVKISLPLKTK